MKVPIGGPFQVTDAMKDNIHRVLNYQGEPNRGRLSPGPFVKEFERKFAAYHGTPQAVMTNSGTSALVVALQALEEVEEWQGRAEVICPAVTFVATINAVFHCGHKPVLVDVDPITYTMDTDQVKAAITPQTKAIMPVHAFGLPADISPILKLASEFNLKVIEDACESLGASYAGNPAGALGDIGCFSFYMSHHITAGVGGMAITGNPWYARKMRSLISHGWDRKDAPMDATDFDFEAIRTRYHFKTIGHSFRATELEAAIALPQLETLEANIQQRLDNAKILTTGLKPFANRLQLPGCPYDRSHSLMMYPIILRDGDKWDLIRHLERAGIDTREMLPLTNQPCYDGMFDEDNYPVAKWINEQGFYVGCSQYLRAEHMAYVVARIGEYFE
jgi:dTDP-4-amino-4,6-dideoxygalactose transaminase